MSQKIISIIFQFHYAMRTCERLDDGEHSGWFLVEWGPRQVYALETLLFNVFIARVIRVVLTRFETCGLPGDSQKEIRGVGEGGSNGRRSRPGDVTMGYLTIA